MKWREKATAVLLLALVLTLHLPPVFLFFFDLSPLVLVIPPSSPPSLPPPTPPRRLPALALRNRIGISINTIGIVDTGAAARALPSHRCSKDSIPARCPMWVEFVAKACVVSSQNIAIYLKINSNFNGVISLNLIRKASHM